MLLALLYVKPVLELAIKPFVASGQRVLHVVIKNSSPETQRVLFRRAYQEVIC